MNLEKIKAGLLGARAMIAYFEAEQRAADKPSKRHLERAENWRIKAINLLRKAKKL